MLFASIIIGYYFTMTVLLRKNKTNNRNKAYAVLLMTSWMGLLEGIMPGNFATISIFSFLIILFVYLIYNQVGINENQFMLSMIEHHQMAIDMANQLTTDDPRLKRIQRDILQSQQREINQMHQILNERDVPDSILSLFA